MKRNIFSEKKKDREGRRRSGKKTDSQPNKKNCFLFSTKFGKEAPFL